MKKMLFLLVVFLATNGQAYEINLSKAISIEELGDSYKDALINVSSRNNTSPGSKESRKRTLGVDIRAAFMNYTKKSQEIFNELSPEDLDNDQLSEIGQVFNTLSKLDSELEIFGANNANELKILCGFADAPVDTLKIQNRMLEIACSKGNETYLNQEFFLNLGLSEQVSVLLFERLSTLKDHLGNSMSNEVLGIVDGIGLYTSLITEQKEDTYRKLSLVETKALSNFYLSAESLQYRNSNATSESSQYVAHPYGGGRIHKNSKISLDAIVSLNSKVANEIIIKGNAKIINSQLLGQKGIIENNVEIKNTQVYKNIFVKNNSSITDSTFSGELVLGENVIFLKSSGAGKLKIGNNSKITNSKIKSFDLSIMEEVEIGSTDIALERETRMIAQRQNIQNAIISDYWHEHLFLAEAAPKGFEFETSYQGRSNLECSKTDDGKNTNLSYSEDKRGNFAKADIMLKITRTEKDGFFKKKYFCSETINFSTKYTKFNELGVNDIFLLQNTGELKKASPTLLRKENIVIGMLPNSDAQFYWKQISGEYVSVQGYDLYLNIP